MSTLSIWLHRIELGSSKLIICRLCITWAAIFSIINIQLAVEICIWSKGARTCVCLTGSYIWISWTHYVLSLQILTNIILHFLFYHWVFVRFMHWFWALVPPSAVLGCCTCKIRSLYIFKITVWSLRCQNWFGVIALLGW